MDEVLVKKILGEKKMDEKIVDYLFIYLLFINGIYEISIKIKRYA